MSSERYRDRNLPVEERVEDLLARMTTAEKIKQTDQFFIAHYAERDEKGMIFRVDWDKMWESMEWMSVGSVQMRGITPALANKLQRWAVEKTRLGIPFLFSEEALHGLGDPRATIFPQQLGLAGTFEPELAGKMGHAIARETRAYGVHETFSPVMDLTKDPRYGRVEESYGEDTYLCGEFAREMVKGMQGDDLTANDAVAAEPKHYVGYGTPVGGLNCAPSAFGRHDVFAWCLPVFEEAIVGGGACNVMCSYNSIDGSPVSSDHELLTDVLRGQYGMRGFVRSDLTAVSRLWGTHFTAEDKPEAIRQGMTAGVDLQLYDFTHEEWSEGIKSLIAEGRMSEEVLNEACRRVLRMKFLLGLFEHPYVNEGRYEQIARCPEHLELALDIARKSICLLKNEGGLLPLSREVKTIAVVGPGAGQAALGDYIPEPVDVTHTITVLEGIKQLAAPDQTILYAEGCSYLDKKRKEGTAVEAGMAAGADTEEREEETESRAESGNEEERWEEAAEIVRRAEVAVVCLGDNKDTSGENLDRAELTLPGRQLEFLKMLYRTGTPIILVLQNGRPMALTWEHGHIPVILECWFPGERGGLAIAEMLFGRISPSGRLPMSFPRMTGQVPCPYNRLPGGGIRYVEGSWDPLYPFGYGLTYTQFAYSGLRIEGDGKTAAQVEAGDTVKVSFTVKNIGDRFGEEVAQLYVRDMVSSTVKPKKELAGFRKVALNPGEECRVSLELGRRQLRTLDRTYVWHVEPGVFRVMVGGNAADEQLSGEFALKADLPVRGQCGAEHTGA